MLRTFLEPIQDKIALVLGFFLVIGFVIVVASFLKKGNARSKSTLDDLDETEANANVVIQKDQQKLIIKNRQDLKEYVSKRNLEIAKVKEGETLDDEISKW